jgi:hypothetical protein
LKNLHSYDEEEEKGNIIHLLDDKTKLREEKKFEAPSVVVRTTEFKENKRKH